MLLTSELERRFLEAVRELSGKEAHAALIGIARDAIDELRRTGEMPDQFDQNCLESREQDAASVGGFEIPGVGETIVGGWLDPKPEV